MPRTPDHALRKLVGEIATANLADLGAILDALTSDQRVQVEALLADFAGLPAPKSTKALGLSPAALKGLSPWLAARLDHNPSGAFEMTPLARKALAASAAGLGDAAPGRAAA